MAQAARAIVDSTPEVLIVLSPHTPRAKRSFAIHEGVHMAGDMGRFGAHNASVHLPIAATAVEQVHAGAARLGVSTWRAPSPEVLDHGAAVPLIFAQRAGWDGPTVLIALPQETLGQEQAFGGVLAAASDRLGQRWTILASGDMSHRLLPGAPAGYEPRAREFDATFVKHLKQGTYERLAHIDEGLRQLAAEDCVQTTLIAAAACQWSTQGARFLSYEGPFGVGYSEAILFTTEGAT